MINRLINISFSFLFLAIIAFLSYHCANPRPPAGGPEDIYPPIVMKTEPGNYSSNFKGDKIQLYFDEFVKLNDVSNQVFISPPQYEMPEFTVRGKSVIIEFQEELLDSTTYNIFFGKSIVDITANNPLDNYSFVFSTGDRVDSLVLLGEVRNAFSRKLEPDVLVMLYNDHYDTVPLDSAPYLIRPVYVSKTYDDGKFALISLKQGKYKLFALKDVNSNYLFDLPNEHIAFWDSLIIPTYPETLFEADTLADTLDQALMPGEALESDSLLTGLDAKSELPYYHLMIFNEIDSTQRLIDAELTKEQLLTFIFRYPTSAPLIEPVNQDLEEAWKLDEWNMSMDTLQRWLLRVDYDSVLFQVMDDTLVLDTVELPLRKVERKGLFKQKKEEELPEVLKFKNNIKGGELNFPGPVKLFFTYPLEAWDFSAVRLFTPKDTILVDVKFEDTITRRTARIDYSWKEKTNYAISFPDSILRDIIGRQNDSVDISFTTKSLEDYGAIFVSITLPDDSLPYIIQLMDEKERVIKERIMHESGMQAFELLNPEPYKLKAIRDVNRNGRWDTGVYHQMRQPEKVYYFGKMIDVRPNWELEEEWDIGE